MAIDQINGIDTIEKQILTKPWPHSIKELTDFPFSGFTEIIELEKQRKIHIATPYNIEALKIFGTQGEYIMHLVWAWLPLFVIIIYAILAFALKKYVLLLSIPLALYGHFVSSPYNKMRRSLSGISVALFIILLFISKAWAFVVLSFLISLIFAWTSREQYDMAIKERALSSEIIFTYMYSNGIVSILDIINQKYISKDKK